MTTARPMAALSIAVLVLLAPAVASAHVSVSPTEAPRGVVAELTFRVPNERNDAGTTKVEVNFPAESPLATVDAPALPGWRSNTTRTPLAAPVDVAGKTMTEAVTKLTWDGGPITGSGSQEFKVSVGPLPTTGTELVFKVLQTYSDGEVVRWIEVREPGAAQGPENAAPVLRLAGAPVAATTVPSTSTTTAAPPVPSTTLPAAPTVATTAVDPPEDGGGSAGGIIAATVGGGALAALAGAALLRRRGRQADGDPGPS